MRINTDLNIDQLLKDIAIPRTRDGLESYYNSIMEKVAKDTSLIRLARIRTGRFKEFFQELVPLIIFSRSKYYNENTLLNIVVGNQQFDAIIWDGHNERRLEFSNYINGETRNREMIQLNENGFSDILVGDVFDSQSDYLKEFERCVIEKSSKGYKDTEIVFVVNVEEIHRFTFEFNVEELKNNIIGIIQGTNFGNNKIYLLLSQEFSMFSQDQVILIK